MIQASAILVQPSLVGPREARRRVLKAWAPGTQVYSVAEGWLLVWPEPRPLRCDRTLGLPVLDADGSLLGFPFGGPSAGHGTLVHMRAGRVVRQELGTAEDPSTWLDCGGFSEADVQPLGDAAPANPPRVVAADPARFDAREDLSGIPRASPEHDALVSALLRKDVSSPLRATRPGREPFLSRFLRLLASFRDRQPPTGSRTQPAAPPAPTAFRRLMGRWLASLNQWIWRSQMGMVLGRRHAAHLQRTIEMFERGDTHEALRHAIPLSGPVAETLQRLRLGVPGPRRELELQARATVASTSLGLGPELYGRLQQLYRDAFQRLEAQGRIDEAAFVLAELLHANEEAVAFLERHGRLRLAAEMAEARELPAGLVVRQWFVAGDRRRAIEVAARRGAFEDAVVRLERSGSTDDAASLRLLWSDSLAEAGDYAAAVKAVWPLERARGLAVAWIDRALAANAPSSVSLLLRKLEIRPEAFSEIRDRVAAVLEADDADGLAVRSALARELARPPGVPGARALARLAVRSALRDAAAYGSDYPPSRFRELVHAAGDGALRADVPALAVQSVVPLARWTQPFAMEIDAAHVGTGPIHDAAFLPSGRVLAARGESGVILLSRLGEPLVHFDVPAERLVISDHGDRAIALARRGERWRLSRIDLLARRARDWCDASFDAFAADYDGRTWFVASRDLFAIDTTRAPFEASWSAPDVTASPEGLKITRTASGCFLFVPGAEPQVWSYELPSIILRERREASREHVAALAVSDQGLLLLHGHPAEGSGPVVHWEDSHRRWRRRSVTRAEERPGAVTAAHGWAALVLHDQGGSRVVLLDAAEAAVRADLRLERSTRVSTRLSPGFLTLSDDLGRLVVLDLHHGWLLRDLRI